MDATKLGKRLDCELETNLEWTARSPKRLYVSVPPEHLYEVFDWLLANLPGFRLGTSTGIDLREGVGVFHHFPVNGTPLVVTLKVLAPKPNPHVPSLAVKIPSAGWIEREIHDLLGVVFDGHPDLSRLVKAEAFPDTFPLRRDFDAHEFKESIGEHLDF
jgi:Ni,Fe-hydrogenase III component G